MRIVGIAIILVATLVISTGAAAQNVYKCGNSYSQIPCTNATRLAAGDARTAAQKKESDKAVSRDMQAAKSMEKERLAEEKRAQASGRESAKVMEKISAAQAPKAAPPAKDEVRRGAAPKKKTSSKTAEKTADQTAGKTTDKAGIGDKR